MTIANQDEKNIEMDLEFISITDLDGVITYANDALCEAIGYKNDDIVGEKASLLNHKDMPKAALLNLKVKLKSRKVWRGAVKKVTHDGQHFWVKEIITPIYENSSIVAFQSVCKPLNERQKLNAIKIYSEINQNDSIFYMWENFYYRFSFYSIVALLIFISSLFEAKMSYAYSIIPVLIYYCEISKSTTFFETLTGNFDDVSRYIFNKSNGFQSSETDMSVKKNPCDRDNELLV